MALRRVDSNTVVDDTGAQFWLPDLGAMDPGIPQVDDAAAVANAPLPPNIPLPGAGAPPDPNDPTAALMPPEPTPMQPGLGLPQSAVDAAGAVPKPSPTSPPSPGGWYGGPPPLPPSAPEPPAAPGANAPTIQAPGLPAAPRTVGQADAQERDAFEEMGQGYLDAASAQADAQESAASREAAAMEKTVAERDRTRVEQDRLHAAYAEKADQETADWVREQQEIAAEKPDPSHYFASRAGWQKVAWIVALASSAWAAGADQSKNLALKMLTDEVDKDVAEQRASIERRMRGHEAKGRMMERQQDRTFARMKDQESMAYQRIDAVERYMLAQAKVPGPKERAAALQAAAAAVGEKKYEFVNRVATRKHAEATAAADLAFRASEAKRDRDFRADESLKERNLRRELAQMEIDAKAANAKDAGAGDYRTLPRSTGFRLTDGTGKDVGEVTVPKEQYAEVARVAQTYTHQAEGLQKLRGALSKLSGSEYVLRNDAEFISALEETVGPVAKALNGGSGQMSDKDSARGYKAVLGVDPNSLVAQLKGPGRDEILKLLDKRIATLPDRASNEIAIASGTSLPPGVRLSFKVREDLVAQDRPDPTTEDRLQSLGVSAEPRAFPKTREDAERLEKRAKEFGPGAGAPPLPPDLQTIVDEATTGVHGMPTKRTDIADAALNKIANWRALHAKDEGAVEAADAAKLYIEVRRDKAGPREGLVHAAELYAAGLVMTGGSPAEVRTALKKQHGIELTDEELADLVERARRRVDADTPRPETSIEKTRDRMLRR